MYRLPEEDLQNLTPEEREQLEKSYAAKQAPISMEPLVSNKDPSQQNDLYKSEQNVDPITEELKKQSKDLELTGQDRALNLGQTISSAVQEAGKVFEQESTGRDTWKERENIKAGQERLEKNLEGREALRAQLNQKLAERQAGIEAEKLRRDEYLRKVRKDESDIAFKNRPAGEGQKKLAVGIAKSRGIDIPVELINNMNSTDIDKFMLDMKAIPIDQGEFYTLPPIIDDNGNATVVAVSRKDPKNRQVINLGGIGRTKPVSNAEAVANRQRREDLPAEFKDKQREYIMKFASPATQKAVFKVNEDFQKNVIKEEQDAQREFASLDSLMKEVKAGSAMASSAFMNRVPRVFAGEKGVLTDRDVARNSGSVDLYNRFQKFVQKNITGETMTDLDIHEANSIIQELKQRVPDMKQLIKAQYEVRLKDTVGEHATWDKMFPGSASPQIQTPTGQAQPSNVQSPQGKTVVKKQYSEKANKTKVIYSDGTEEIKDGKQ